MTRAWRDRLVGLALGAAVLASPAAVSAQPVAWPQFRGPAGEV